MSDLSDSSHSQTSAQPVVQTPTTVSPSGNKEVVGGPVNQAEGLRDATGSEVTVSAETSGAGVRVRPTVVPIPPKVQQMGVKGAGQNVSAQTTSTVVLPLTDDRIALGLHQSIKSSFRWLAQWCVRRIKQLHKAVKTVQGTLLKT